MSTVIFVLLSGTFFETLYKFPAYSPQLRDLFYAAPLGLIGGFVGLLFMLSLRRLQVIFQPMKGHVVLRGLLGGMGMGIIGALLPLTLFSGEQETADLITHAMEIGVVMLIVLGLAKLFATSLLLATGWKGGYIFPIMFASVALGLAVNLMFPSIPVAVTVAATMAGALMAAMRAPLVRGALHDNPCPKRDSLRDCRRRGCQCIADRSTGNAGGSPRRKTGGIAPGHRVKQKIHRMTYE